MEDSHELLLDMHKGLHDEEKWQWPSKVRDRSPAVVDSVFQAAGIAEGLSKIPNKQTIVRVRINLIYMTSVLLTKLLNK